MATDGRQNLIQTIENELVNRLSAETYDVVVGIVIKALNNYEVVERCTDIVVHDDFNERILKRYCACLMVDGKSEKTIAQYKRTATKLADFIGKPYTEIGVYDIRYFLACEKERGVSDRTYEVRKPFSEVEIDRLRSACDTLKKRALVEFLLTSGVRVSELASMEVSDVDGVNVHVRHGKGNKERMTFINNVAKSHLQKYLLSRPEQGGALFYNKNHDPLQAGGIRNILKTIEKDSGVENVHPHRFRRTFATGLANRGMNIQEIQKLLGHSNLNTTMEYVCIDNSKIKTSYQQYIA